MRPLIDVPALARGAVGVVLAGVLAGVLFLIMVEGSFRKGITEFDFAHILGTAIRGSAEEARYSGQALGVVGDTAGPDGLYATLVAGVVVLAFHALVIVRLVRARWWVRGLVLGALVALLLGLVYAPYADSKLDTPIGAWGSAQGGWTPVVLIVSAFGTGVVAARCYDLIATSHWWEPKGLTVDETLEQLTGVDTASLELSEDGREQGSMHP